VKNFEGLLQVTFLPTSSHTGGFAGVTGCAQNSCFFLVPMQAPIKKRPIPLGIDRFRWAGDWQGSRLKEMFTASAGWHN
jgi:hypothetical protein